MGSTGLRMLSIVVGILMIILGIVGMFFTTGFFWVIMVIASIGALFYGIAAIVEGVSDKEAKSIMRILMIIFGIILIILSLIILIGSIINPLGAAELFVFIVAIVILIVGIRDIIEGIAYKEERTWVRILDVVVGILGIIIAILVFLEPTFGALFVTIFVIVWLIMTGIIRIVAGFAAKE